MPADICRSCRTAVQQCAVRDTHVAMLQCAETQIKSLNIKKAVNLFCTTNRFQYVKYYGQLWTSPPYRWSFTDTLSFGEWKFVIEFCVEYEYTCCISMETTRHTVCMNTYTYTVYSIRYMCMCVCVRAFIHTVWSAVFNDMQSVYSYSAKNSIIKFHSPILNVYACIHMYTVCCTCVHTCTLYAVHVYIHVHCMLYMCMRS